MKTKNDNFRLIEDSIEKVNRLLTTIPNNLKNLHEDIQILTNYNVDFIDFKKNYTTVDIKEVETIFDKMDELFRRRKQFELSLLKFLKCLDDMRKEYTTISQLTQFDEDIYQFHGMITEILDHHQKVFLEQCQKDLDSQCLENKKKVDDKLVTEKEKIQEEMKQTDDDIEELMVQMKELESKKEELEKKKQNQQAKILFSENQCEEEKKKIEESMEKQKEELKNQAERDKNTLFNKYTSRIKFDKDKLCIAQSKEYLLSWTGKNTLKVIFDSHEQPIEIGKTQDVEKIILGKKNLIYIIFDTVGNVFGGILTVAYNELEKAMFSSDTNVFSLKNISYPNQNPMIFNPRKDKNKIPFVFTNKHHEMLFSFGYCSDPFENSDIVVFKNGSKRQSFCGDHFYNYENRKTPLISEKYFTMRRLLIYEACNA